MSRSGYSDDFDGRELHLYRGQVASAARGRRGQRFFADLVSALDAMPEKRLIVGFLETPDGAVCALGALGKARGIELPAIHEDDDISPVADIFGIAECLARETVFENDENGRYRYQVRCCSVCHGWGEIVGSSHGRIQRCRECLGDGRVRKTLPETPEDRWGRIRAWAVAHISASAP